MPQPTEIMKMVQRGPAQKYISDKRLHEIYEHAKQFAMEVEEKENEVDMMFIAHMHRREATDVSKEEWLEIPIMFADWPPPDNQKYEVLQGLGIRLATEFEEYMLVCMVQISEGWMATYHEEDGAEAPYLPKGATMPSERPDKIEILLIDACTVDQRKDSTMIPIIRNASGKFATWGAPVEHLYDPDDDGEIGAENYLVMNIFKGSTGAAVAKKESD
jgi:hypothetical protein